MAKVFTTEITSEKITSDNPIHQRLFKAYVIAAQYVTGQLLEVGCGEGRGIEFLRPLVDHYTALDKIPAAIGELAKRFPDSTFIATTIPPLEGLEDNRYDTVISFQVIEHVREDSQFLKEIHRVLKPGGTALLTTPNRKMSLSRNPWHIREYAPQELQDLASAIFRSVTLRGIGGDNKVMAYYEKNRRSVQRVARWDIFNLQNRLPAYLLKIPYELLNRWNRNKLQSGDHPLVSSIHHDNYILVDNPEDALDLLLIVRK